MALELLREDDGLHLSVQRIFQEGKQILVLLHLLGGFLLLLLRLEAEIVRRNGAELLVIHLHHHAQGKLVHVVGEIQDLVALFLERLRLRQQIDAVHTFAAGIVNVFLVFLHAGDILLEGDELLFRRGIEQQQILQQVLVHAVVGVNAVT